MRRGGLTSPDAPTHPIERHASARNHDSSERHARATVTHPAQRARTRLSAPAPPPPARGAPTRRSAPSPPLPPRAPDTRARGRSQARAGTTGPRGRWAPTPRPLAPPRSRAPNRSSNRRNGSCSRTALKSTATSTGPPAGTGPAAGTGTPSGASPPSSTGPPSPGATPPLADSTASPTPSIASRHSPSPSWGPGTSTGTSVTGPNPRSTPPPPAGEPAAACWAAAAAEEHHRPARRQSPHLVHERPLWTAVRQPVIHAPRSRVDAPCTTTRSGRCARIASRSSSAHAESHRALNVMTVPTPQNNAAKGMNTAASVASQWTSCTSGTAYNSASPAAETTSSQATDRPRVRQTRGCLPSSLLTAHRTIPPPRAHGPAAPNRPSQSLSQPRRRRRSATECGEGTRRGPRASPGVLMFTDHKIPNRSRRSP